MFADAIDFPGSGILEFNFKFKIIYHRSSRFMREEEKFRSRCC